MARFNSTVGTCWILPWGQNADPLNIQAGPESEPENQISLNVVENTSTQSLGHDNPDISTVQGTLLAIEDFKQLRL